MDLRIYCAMEILHSIPFFISDEAQKVFLISIVLAKNGSAKSSENPIDDAEAKTKTKEAAKGGNEIHRTHPDAPLHF